MNKKIKNISFFYRYDYFGIRFLEKLILDKQIIDYHIDYDIEVNENTWYPHFSDEDYPEYVLTYIDQYENYTVKSEEVLLDKVYEALLTNTTTCYCSDYGRLNVLVIFEDGTYEWFWQIEIDDCLVDIKKLLLPYLNVNPLPLFLPFFYEFSSPTKINLMRIFNHFTNVKRPYGNYDEEFHKYIDVINFYEDND